jgi:hypothetical protein
MWKRAREKVIKIIGKEFFHVFVPSLQAHTHALHGAEFFMLTAARRQKANDNDVPCDVYVCGKWKLHFYCSLLLPL